MGSILDLARRDAKRYVTSGGFETEIVLTTPDDAVTITLSGYASKHFINFDSDGSPINSKNAHICIDEDILTNAGYPVRNARNEVALLKHKVSCSDSTGSIKNYTIRENFPDETLGLIVCILGDKN